MRSDCDRDAEVRRLEHRALETIDRVRESFDRNRDDPASALDWMFERPVRLTVKGNRVSLRFRRERRVELMRILMRCPHGFPPFPCGIQRRDALEHRVGHRRWL